ncbi:MAG TPA: hypothetical protein ENH52_17215 [Nitrospirae bacterium]|nr:hypothetical protein [Nitrospirota bacterium]
MSNYYKELSVTLSELLSNRYPKIEPPPSGMNPLFLLLNIKPDLVGFAVLNGNLEGDYSNAFNKFREIYAVHSTDWADFDLTLVICVDKGQHDNEDFYENIERDPYFCRKFVIDISEEGDVKTALGHLPFIPLSPEKIIGLRPTITAQTLLMEHGVKSSLAKYLAVPHAKSSDGIISDVREGKLGDLTWDDIKEIGRKDGIPLEAKPKIRIKELEIHNFRAYKGKHKFNLDADLIVLYGANGLGKTSFFEAIDFICTGSEAKLDDKAGRDTKRIVNALKHLDVSRNESYVKTLISGNNGDCAIERRMDDTKNVSVDGQLFNRADILMSFSGLKDELIDIRIENFVRLFRATHLFGQDFQSLTSELHKKSRLSEEIVSRMLALQDYFEAIKKSKEILNKLEKEYEIKNAEITHLIVSLNEVEDEIKQLESSVKIIEQPELVQTIGMKLFDKIVQEKNLNIKKKPTEFNKNIVMGWRAGIEARCGAILKDLNVVENIASKIKDYYSKREELIKNRKEACNLKENITNLGKNIIEKRKYLDNINEDINKSVVEESNLRKKNDNLMWLLITKKEYTQTITTIEKENKTIRNINERLIKLIQEYEKSISDKKVVGDEIATKHSQIESLEKTAKNLAEFLTDVPEWINLNRLERELTDSLPKHEQAVEQAKKNMQSKLDELQTALNNQKESEEYVSILQKTQNELTTLLDNIEKYILTNNCPVCGTAHKSREELLERLKLQRGMRPDNLNEGIKKLSDADKNVLKIKSQFSDAEAILKNKKQEVEKKLNELAIIKQKLRNLIEKAVKLELPIAPESLHPIINAKKEKILNQIETKKKELKDLKLKLTKIEESIINFLKQKSGFEGELRVSESKKKQLSERLEVIKKESLARQVSLGEAEEIIQKEIESNKNIRDKLIKQIRMLRDKSQNLDSELTNISAEININTKELKRKEQKIKESVNFIEKVENSIKELNLDKNISEQKLLLRKENFKNELSRLRSLQNEITNFEIALDSAMLSAILNKAKQNSTYINKKIESLKKDQSQYKDLQVYFFSIKNKLQSIRNNSLKDYTKKYGPLASVIQGRLRTPYGFGKMNLRTEKGDIIIEVERGKWKSIPPSDYFSASQINIVALSLFLSASLTQTWSSFAPILLDDPVTHFDDLNAYSFIDLIRGLVLSEETGKGHQFIISTCEDRLFRLMKQKFSKMNGRAIFYAFKSIGEKGPVWSEEKY